MRTSNIIATVPVLASFHNDVTIAFYANRLGF
jgi:hypothetical protein